MQEINKPTNGKWFIAYNKSVPPESHGFVGPNNNMITGFKTLEEFDSEELYLKRAKELGINLEENDFI